MLSQRPPSSRVALVVDPEASITSQLCSIAERSGYHGVEHRLFRTARSRLLTAEPPAALVANVRLDAFNGIHLAYLLRQADTVARIVLYADPHDPMLAHEARRAGAFYQPLRLLLLSLSGWLEAVLPAVDRRDEAGPTDGLSRAAVDA